VEEDDEPPSAAGFVSLGVGFVSLLSSLCCCVPLAQWLSLLTTPVFVAVGIGAGVIAVRAPGRKTIGVLGLILNGVAAAWFAVQLVGYLAAFGWLTWQG
jgi:hypothetical protein